MKKIVFGFVFWMLVQIITTAQPILVPFSSIPKSGTALVYAHQDDDIIWFYPWWNITEKFLEGAMPSTTRYRKIVREQQVFLDNNAYPINYEQNWSTLWPDVTDEEYYQYYFNKNPLYSYLLNDHIEPRYASDTEELSISDINKMKAKLEQYIASSSVSRIITHNNWGEYGHRHHMAVNKAVRELAVKYRKDVWMLGIDDAYFHDIEIPSGLTYTLGNFNDNTLWNGIRDIYLANSYWTYLDYTPTGNHSYIKVVDAGNDLSNAWPGQEITTPGPTQIIPGSFIFDGTDDYLTLQGNNNEVFSIAMQVNPDQIRAMDISKMSEYPTSITYDRVLSMNGSGSIIARLGSGSITSSTTLTTGNWASLVMIGDGSNLKLYINGVSQGNIPVGPAITNYITPEFILGQAQETASCFSGQIANVHLYEYELSPSDISYLAGTLSPIHDTITSSAGPSGNINPKGKAVVVLGGNRSFTITPSVGYQIADVLVDGVSVGAVPSYSFTNVTVNHTITATFSSLISIALNQPASAQSFEAGRLPSLANDADGSNNSYWSADPYPQWWKVDLGAVYDLSGIVIRNYVDNYRYYQYNIEASIDGQTYTQIAVKTNTNQATDAGDSYSLNTSARYLRVNMTYNLAGNGVHITDFRAYGTINTNYHSISASAGTGGTISPSSDVVLLNGANQTYVITPAIGYQIADVLVDGSSVGVVSSYSFTNVTANHTIAASFSQSISIALNKPTTCQSFENPGVESSMANDSPGVPVTYWSANPYPQWWQVDLEAVYDLTGIVIRNFADGGHYYQYNIEASIDGLTYTQVAAKTNTNLATNEGDSYPVSTSARYLRVNMTYNNVDMSVQISDFRAYGTINPNYHIISSSTATGGSITPSGKATVFNGSNQTYVITPTIGYQIANVLVDGGPVGAVSSYTFTNVTANHTIAVTFSPMVSIALNKTATAQSFEFGHEPSFANDNDGTNNSYWSSSGDVPQMWQVDLGGVYDISGIVIRNYFDNSRYYLYTVEASIDGLTYTQIAAKTNTNRATDEGDSYPVNSTSARYLRVNTTFNSSNINAHITDFRAYGTARIMTYSITASSGVGGTITPQGVVNVNQGVNQIYTITPNSGYHIADVSVDSVSVGTTQTYTFNNVTANHTIVASFVPTVVTNVAFNKPTTCQSNQSDGESYKANDSDGSNNSSWAAGPYKQWWKVDLRGNYDLTSIVIRNYVDGTRYYQYFIQVSTDDITYTQVAVKVNRNVATDAGDSYNINSTARFIRVNMTYNSANMGVQITDFRAYGSSSVVSPTYSITSNSGMGGVITPLGDSILNQGTNLTYAITANNGYRIAGVSVDNSPIGVVSTYTFNNVTANHSIAATFTPSINIALNKPSNSEAYEMPYDSYMANDADGTNNSYWSGPQWPNWWVVDLEGIYNLTSLVIRNWVDGSRYYHYNIEVSTDNITYTSLISKTNNNIAIDEGDSYIVNVVARFVRVNMTFNSANSGVHISDFRVYGTQTFSINAIASTGGSINPPGISIANPGTSQIYTITPNSGYQISDVTVDNVSVGPVSNYTFNNINTNHTIEVTFLPYYNITSRAGIGGTINPSGALIVNQGTNQTYSITANSGYRITDVMVDRVSVGAVSTYTFNNITGNHTITVTFAPTYTITSRAGRGGTISPAGEVIVSQHANQNYIIIANSGYKISDVKVDGISVGPVFTFTFNDVTINHNISVTFSAIITYTITSSAGGDGTINPVGVVTINEGSNQTYAISANSGFQISDVTVDNISVGPVSYYTFYNISTNHNIAVTFSSIGGTKGNNQGLQLMKDFTGETLQNNVNLSLNRDSYIETVKLYPNPFYDSFTLNINSPTNDVFNMSIVDLSGRIVYTDTKIISNSEYTFNLQLSKGIYILCVINKEKKIIIRIAKY